MNPARTEQAMEIGTLETVHPAALERWAFGSLLAWGIGVQTNEILATVGMAATALTVGVGWSKGLQIPRARSGIRAWIPLLLFCAWALMAPAFAGRPPTATGVARLADWLSIPIAAHALSLLDARRRTALAVVFGVTFLTSCLAAALQHFGFWPAESFFAHWSWTRIPFYRVYEPVPEANHRFMAGGLLFHRLKFAHVGGLAVMAFFVLGLAAKGRVRILGLCCAAVGFASVLEFPYARAASAALVVSACAALILSFQDRRAILPALTLAVLTAVAVLAYRPMRDRFLSGLTPAGSGDRSEILSTGVRAVMEHPITGVGLGRFRPSYFSSFDTPQDVLDNPGKAHNQFLSVAAEVGIPGAALFVFLLLWLARSFRSSQLGVLGISALVFFSLLAMVHDPLIHPPFSMALALCLGAASARPPMSER